MIFGLIYSKKYTVDTLNLFKSLSLKKGKNLPNKKNRKINDRFPGEKFNHTANISNIESMYGIEDHMCGGSLG